ncbi:DUF2079 domain-containing protein [Nostoc sphaeroides]|uniref:DUF2079 domain-containing protein n=1 Tax=Nostoc sphaeroides CCNUC1 TaxID=2653204 RepID=A0A5P8VU75_9NOSO|nr:DUF2079 domain-containing protein [Nostoc sphaeroides]QFS43937.1 hypothetical protein GXM_01410 [Nostoc sphaeroides CCNUC1]
MRKKLNQLGYLGWIIGVSALILFGCSSLRHELFQSTAFDLGIFDQAVYLISQGQPPITSFMGFHILGDHAAWIFYPLALLYKIYPSVYWLFVVQAAALALGALPAWHLAHQAGLKENQAIAIAFVYLLYPLVFNANLFDFHAEVIALPLLLAAVLAARLSQIGWFCLSILLVLGCKAVLSLTVAAMGVWLILFEKRRLYGAIAICAGIGWFIIATQVIIPFFSGAEAAAVGRYSYLGNSVLGIAKNIVFQPGLILGKVFSLDNLGYLVLLLAPVIWGLSLQGIKPLVGAIPCLALNILADYQPQKDLLHQYSIPAMPFLLLAIISSLAAGKGWIQNKRAIILWSLVAFLSLAKFTHFGGRYLESIDTWQATKQAIAQIQTKGSVYTTAEISPHLSNRKLITYTNADSSPADLNVFNYVLLNVRHPGFSSNQEFAANLVNQLKTNQEFQLKYQRDDVYLFVKVA